MTSHRTSPLAIALSETSVPGGAVSIVESSVSRSWCTKCLHKTRRRDRRNAAVLRRYHGGLIGLIYGRTPVGAEWRGGRAATRELAAEDHSWVRPCDVRRSSLVFEAISRCVCLFRYRDLAGRVGASNGGGGGCS